MLLAKVEIFTRCNMRTFGLKLNMRAYSSFIFVLMETETFKVKLLRKFPKTCRD